MIIDAGLAKPSIGGRVYAAVKGMVDSGVNVLCDEKCFPSEEQINGSKIGDDRTKLFENVKQAIEKGSEKEA